MRRKKISPIIMMLLWLFSAEALADIPIEQATDYDVPLLMAQRKSHDLGNCFSVSGCKGDSIGMMWVEFPDYCKTMGGRSWMDRDGKCYDLPAGPHNIQGP